MLGRMIGPNYKDKYTFLALIGDIDFKTGQTSFEVVPYMKGLPIEIKVGCAFMMVIWSEFRTGQCRDNDNREDAPHFT